MTRVEVAALLEELAVAVEHLPGVSRRNPHVFAECKSELAGAMRRRAKDLRTQTRNPVATAAPGAIVPGPRVINRRTILVERRRA